MKRRLLLVLGFAVLAGMWLGPVLRPPVPAFTAHMVMHMGVVALAAPLLAFGLAGTTHDPVCLRPQWFPPVPLSLVELIVVWAWHAPALHRWARHSAGGFIAEQASFLIAGGLVWLSVFGGERAQRRERAAAGLAALLLTAMHMTLLGALLALSPRPLYAHDEPVGTISALDDQHLGGAIMVMAGGAAYLAGGLWLTTELIRGAWAKRRTAA